MDKEQIKSEIKQLEDDISHKEQSLSYLKFQLAEIKKQEAMWEYLAKPLKIWEITYKCGEKRQVEAQIKDDYNFYNYTGEVGSSGLFYNLTGENKYVPETQLVFECNSEEVLSIELSKEEGDK